MLLPTDSLALWRAAQLVTVHTPTPERFFKVALAGGERTEERFVLQAPAELGILPARAVAVLERAADLVAATAEPEHDHGPNDPSKSMRNHPEHRKWI